MHLAKKVRSLFGTLLLPSFPSRKQNWLARPPMMQPALRALRRKMLQGSDGIAPPGA